MLPKGGSERSELTPCTIYFDGLIISVARMPQSVAFGLYLTGTILVLAQAVSCECTETCAYSKKKVHTFANMARYINNRGMATKIRNKNCATIGVKSRQRSEIRECPGVPGPE